MQYAEYNRKNLSLQMAHAHTVAIYDSSANTVANKNPNLSFWENNETLILHSENIDFGQIVNLSEVLY